MQLSVDDFLDALDLEQFVALFARLGFVKVPGSAHVYVRPGQARPRPVLVLPEHRDREGHWRNRALAAARDYTALTGQTLWWLPQTDTEAAYASLILTLLHDIRPAAEESTGDWNGGDVITIATAFFTRLGLDLTTDIPQKTSDGHNRDRRFLAAVLACHRDLV